MKEKDPEYILNKRKNKQTATRCRVCGGQLLIAQEIEKRFTKCVILIILMYI